MTSSVSSANGLTSVTPRWANHASTRCTSFSGADAPDVIPTVSTPSNQRSSISLSSSMRKDGTPRARETSTSRFELEELREPITRRTSTSESIAFTARCRLVVA